MKKTLLSLTLLGLTGLGSLQAAIIGIASEGNAVDGDETYTSAQVGNGNTLAIAQHPNWAAPLGGTTWVSYGITGDPNAPGYFMPANSTIVSFFDTIVVTGGSVLAGTITVRADDSTAMYINNVKVFDEATPINNSYTVCSDFAPGCLTTTERTIDIASFLSSGNNVFRFDVAQRNSYSFGLNYSGAVSTGAVPEPSTYALIGSALLGLGLVRRRRA